MANTQRMETPAFMQATLGTWYPTHCVVAVLDDATEAGAITDALYTLGLATDDVHFFLAKEVIALDAAAHARAGTVERILANVTALTDEGLAEHEYVRQANEGHNVFVIKCAEQPMVDRVRDLLRTHGAHDIRYYGNFVMEDLNG